MIIALVRRINRERIHRLRAWFASGANLSPAYQRFCLIIYFEFRIPISICHAINQIQLCVQLSVFEIRISRLNCLAVEAFRYFFTRRVSQLNSWLATCCIFVRAIIAISARFTSENLEAFLGARFRVGKITICICFCKIGIVRGMSFVVMMIASDVFVANRALNRWFLIVGVSLFRARLFIRPIQDVGNIACPNRITRVMFIAFFCFRMRISNAIVMQEGAIRGGLYITMAWFIMFISSVLFIFFMFLFGRFFNARGISGFIFLVHLLRSTFWLLIAWRNITIGNSLISFRLFFLIGRRVGVRLILVIDRVALCSNRFNIFGAFFVRVFLSWCFDAICRIKDGLTSFCRA